MDRMIFLVEDGRLVFATMHAEPLAAVEADRVQEQARRGITDAELGWQCAVFAPRVDVVRSPATAWLRTLGISAR